ncbi:hypothetical protein FM038_020625 [Shewanella eurypsychrophilus]|uniref:Uncharacterized protein n=1 Tax=Shewanella eurypsychrophilus TaxID=2593656 RepID=A0ABX6VA33_9GAMM|nr:MULTISPECIES: hypothetical protein [Shewanella]QFU24316.1 hypothetical protein FS418_22340 [Shewanella sp. YLB-09]QPG59516.1 hypothetical protein FM038_020625 [Shewanella eurypsychrophilus]
MASQKITALTADTFSRGALRMTVTLLRGINPQLALSVQNQLFNPINPQPDNTPNPKDNFKISMQPLAVRKVVESLKSKGEHPQVDPGTQMMVKALIIDWINYANLLIELENNKEA